MSNDTMTAPAEVKPYLSWGFNEDTDDMDTSFEDTDDMDTSFEWECMCDELTEVMQKINPKGQWHCNVQNFGWQGRNGYKNFNATKGQSLLQSILPRTECHFKIFVKGKGFGRYFKIQNFHHDSPTGNEWYEVVRFNGRKHPAS